MNKLSPLGTLPALSAALVLVLAAAGAQAQSYCASDGVAQPQALLERFISADCEACWADPGTPKPGRGELALDWIVPGSRGADAPLSAAASHEGLARLQALGRQIPTQADLSLGKMQGTGQPLRVAHGLPFNGYVGASIELKPRAAGSWRAWLLLVETLPAGTEGTPVERNLVRNALQVSWDGTQPRSKRQQRRLFESRPMSIPEGVNADRLRVVGWVEDARGRLAAAAQSRCP